MTKRELQEAINYRVMVAADAFGVEYRIDKNQYGIEVVTMVVRDMKVTYVPFVVSFNNLSAAHAGCTVQCEMDDYIDYVPAGKGEFVKHLSDLLTTHGYSIQK